MPPLNHRISSFYPPNDGEYISPFTAPAMPNLRTQGSFLYKPVVAESAFIPRSPLAPQKLAKLANALGISTPLPASTPPPSASKKTFSTTCSQEERVSPESRAATPSSATSRSATSRYLVHVIPPKHFPHESRKDPEAFARFRRGTLVPLHASLQAQISAIAREYQLPTTHGIVLYLVSVPDSGAPSRSALGKGPRIGEDVWKWVWMKVAEEQPVMSGVGLGLTSAASSPAPPERPMLLRKRSSPARLDLSHPGVVKYPLTPSPSTPSTSTSSTTPMATKREQNKEQESPGEQSNPSQFLSTPSNAAFDPPDSSLGLDTRLLPGLGSPSLLPVLAKVEFDIDRKVGTWYDTWSRSRKIMHKRKGKSVDPQGKLQLRITVNNRKGTISPESSSSDEEDEGYKRLSDSPDFETELMAGGTPRRGDPLSDVFGTDGEAWSDMQSRRPGRDIKGDLTLDGASLSVLQDPENSHNNGASDEEVMSLWDGHNQPRLHLPGQRNKVPPPLTLPTNGGNLEIHVATATPSAESSSFEDSTHLPYLSDRRDTRLFVDEVTREKRAGGIYDDLELDLDADINLEEQRARQLQIREELDVLERNLAQFSPRALKSVELSPDLLPPNSINLNSAPPQRTAFSPVPSLHHGGSQSVQLSSSDLAMNRTGIEGSTGTRNENTIGPPVFRQPALVGTPSPEEDSFKGAHGHMNGSDGNVTYGTPEPQVAWPSVPYSTLASRGEADPLLSPRDSLQGQKSLRHPNSPPKVVLNGKTNGTTKIASSKRKNSSISSMLSNFSGPRETSENKARSKQYEEEASFYTDVPMLQPSLTRRQPESMDSPVLPLSPDPFGRFPSSTDAHASSSMEFPPERTTSLGKHVHAASSSGRDSKTPSSRFSVDSVAEEQQSLKVNKSSNMVSMKSIRKLWRKNDKATSSGVSVPASPDPSTMPSRPSSSATSFRDAENDASRASSPSMHSTPVPARTNQKPRKSSRDSGLDPFYFDQEAKYTARQTPSPSSQMMYQFPPSSSSQGTTTTAPMTNAEKKRSIRKSLVSKWKNGSEGSSSTDSASEPRRRRPSILDIAGVMRSGGGSISMQSPSVPDIPAEYRMSQHSRVQSRGSVSTVLTSFTGSEERVYPRRKPAAQTSTDSSQESVDPIPTPVSAVAPLSFSKGKGKGSLSGSVTLSLASPGDTSDGMRSSFDESQFEIVSPRVPLSATSGSTA